MAPLPSNLRELIERRAADAPDGVFLIAPEDGRALTFAQLRRKALALAAEAVEPRRPRRAASAKRDRGRRRARSA
jgi:acyl-CoA synthetase (AMP-forming)/AMP-acid ligase II